MQRPIHRPTRGLGPSALGALFAVGVALVAAGCLGYLGTSDAYCDCRKAPPACHADGDCPRVAGNEGAPVRCDLLGRCVPILDAAHPSSICGCCTDDDCGPAFTCATRADGGVCVQQPVGDLAPPGVD